MMFFGFNGQGLGWANWANDDCPYPVIGTPGDSDAICCYPGSGQPLCPSSSSPGSSSSSSSGSSSSSSGGGGGDGSIWSGIGTAAGALTKALLLPSSGVCPPGLVKGPNNMCMPLPTTPPWYTTPIGMGALLVGGIVMYKLIAG